MGKVDIPNSKGVHVTKSMQLSTCRVFIACVCTCSIGYSRAAKSKRLWNICYAGK